MPYNTRRKSLSLPSLGIHVPVTHASRAASRLSPISSSTATTTTSTTTSSTRPPSPTTSNMTSPSSRDRAHPNKKAKRSHSEDTDSLLRSAPLSGKRDHATAVKFDHTPPPSPPPADRASVEMVDADAETEGATPRRKVDLEGINDEIVEAVIVQLQNTDNRPHLVKELAAVLMQQLKIVQQYVTPANLKTTQPSKPLLCHSTFVC